MAAREPEPVVWYGYEYMLPSLLHSISWGPFTSTPPTIK
jgi:hypothetical protein